MKLFQDDDEKDIFTQQHTAEDIKPVKKPKLLPEDPEYWDQEEGRWEHLRFANSVKRTIYAAGGVLVLVFIGWVLVWIINPYIDQATQYGYIERVERHGSVFKSYEATLLTYKSLQDTVSPTVDEFKFSAIGAVGHSLKNYRENGIPVRVDYKVYHSAMPWRGCSKVVAVGIDTVSSDSIMPPFGQSKTQ